jgi:hypothetical protein
MVFFIVCGLLVLFLFAYIILMFGLFEALYRYFKKKEEIEYCKVMYITKHISNWKFMDFYFNDLVYYYSFLFSKLYCLKIRFQ